MQPFEVTEFGWGEFDIGVAVGDEVLDTSVRAKLQQMQIALTA